MTDNQDQARHGQFDLDKQIEQASDRLKQLREFVCYRQ
jgi:hypothetical protein